MRLCLVNLMDDMHRQYSNRWLSQPPLCLGALYTVTPRSVQVRVMDEQVDELSWDDDAFAFSVATQLAKKTYAKADELRRKGKIVIMGGYHVTTCPDEVLEHADAIVTNEAETIWPQLCDDLASGCLKKVYAGSPTPHGHMQAIDRTCFEGRRYAFPGALYASRGCTFNCSFCGSSRILGGYRLKTIEMVEHEIDDIKRRHPRTVLQFTDDNPLAHATWRRELLTLLKRKKMHFVMQVTVDQLCDKALIDQLADAGCLGVATGIESLQEDNLGSVDKVQNLGMPIPEAVRYCRQRGMHIAALLIYGLDNDTPERIRQSIKQLRRIPFSVYDVCLLRPFPGTGLYKAMIQQGTTTAKWWLADEHTLGNRVLPGYLRIYFNHQHMSARELQLAATDAIDRLNRVRPADVKAAFVTGMIARAPWFTIRLLAGRAAVSVQARRWKGKLKKLPLDAAPTVMTSTQEIAPITLRVMDEA